jgi:methylmalonyl-CoA mutase C-terminal domain/subunit
MRYMPGRRPRLAGEPALIRVGYEDCRAHRDSTAGISRSASRPVQKVVTQMAPIRIVVAKPGLDGHDRGAKVIARALRDAGMEVIYTGLHQTPEQIVETALQEDADIIGLSVLSGAHMTLFSKVIELLKQRDATDILVFGGGIIPDDDIPILKEMGVAEIFTPGAKMEDVVGWVQSAMAAT